MIDAVGADRFTTWLRMRSGHVPKMVQVMQNTGAKSFYRNDGNGKFTEVGEKAGVSDIGWGMGVAVGDYDNNGYNDVFQGSSSNGYLLTADATGTTYTRENMTSNYGGGSEVTHSRHFFVFY